MPEPEAAKLSDRYQFLEAIRYEAAPCFQELFGFVSDSYDSLEADLDEEDNAMAVSPSAAFDEAVRSWCRRHSIETPWLAEDAAAAIRDVAARQQERAMIEYLGEHRLPPEPTADSLGWSNLVPVLPKFWFEARAWQQSEESWEAYCESVRRTLSRALAQYREQHLAYDRPKPPGKASLAEPALRVRGRLARRHPMPHRHFQWLVRYQVLGWTMADLARDLKIDRKTVKDGIRDAAARVDLKLRAASSGGRPKTRRNVGIVLSDLLAYVRANNRVSPQPRRWHELWDLLPKRRRLGSDWEPPLPLILAAWWDTPALAKMLRLEEHIRYAETHGVLPEVDVFLRALPETDWAHLGDI